jgi:hypothetical protein
MEGRFKSEIVYNNLSHCERLPKCLVMSAREQHLSTLTGDEYLTFLDRMKDKDPKTLKKFILDFDKIHDTLRMLARAKQPDLTRAVMSKSEPEFVDSDDRRYSQAAASIGHHLEATHRRSDDERMSASLDKLEISIHNRRDPAQSYEAGGNSIRPLPIIYRSSNGRRQTLPLVDDSAGDSQ